MPVTKDPTTLNPLRATGPAPRGGNDVGGASTLLVAAIPLKARGNGGILGNVVTALLISDVAETPVISTSAIFLPL